MARSTGALDGSCNQYRQLNFGDAGAPEKCINSSKRGKAIGASTKQGVEAKAYGKLNGVGPSRAVSPQVQGF